MEEELNVYLKSDMPLVSIIVPNYNHEKYLEQRFDTIFNQTFQDFEIIILDDCSSDNSRDIIEKYRYHPKVRKIIYNEVNGGTSYKQWLKGIENSNGELIWLAESDDWSDTHFLELIVPHFKKNYVDVVISDLFFVFNNYYKTPEYLTGDFNEYEGIEFIRNKLLGGCGIPNANMVVFRRKKFDTILNTDWSNLKQSGDWLFWIKLINESKIIQMKDILCYFRMHDSNTTAKNRKLGYDFLEGLDVYKYGKEICLNKFDRKKVYFEWCLSYANYSRFFNKGVKIRVLKKFFQTEKILFIKVLYFPLLNKIRKRVRKILKIK